LNRSIRKTVLIITTVCFVAMVAGLTLKLHLLSHKHPEKHDSSRCSICQMLLSNIGKTSITTEPKIEETNRVEYPPDFICQIAPLFSNIRLPIPRSPPFTL
jgi:hypothetical protein